MTSIFLPPPCPPVPQPSLCFSSPLSRPCPSSCRSSLSIRGSTAAGPIGLARTASPISSFTCPYLSWCRWSSRPSRTSWLTYLRRASACKPWQFSLLCSRVTLSRPAFLGLPQTPWRWVCVCIYIRLCVSMVMIYLLVIIHFIGSSFTWLVAGYALRPYGQIVYTYFRDNVQHTEVEPTHRYRLFDITRPDM